MPMPITLDQNDPRVRKQLVKMLSAPRWSMRLPTCVDTARFISATREDCELRLMVLNDLRISKRATGADDDLRAAIAVALVSFPRDSRICVLAQRSRHRRLLAFKCSVELLTYAQPSLWLLALLLIGAFTLWVSGSGRYAAWLSAFEDVIEEEKAGTPLARCGERLCTTFRDLSGLTGCAELSLPIKGDQTCCQNCASQLSSSAGRWGRSSDEQLCSAITLRVTDATTTSSVILHAPHGGREIPAAHRGAFTLTDAELEAELAALTDHDTDRLVASVRGVPSVVNGLSRFVVDVERLPDEIEEMARVGMGRLYTHVHAGPADPGGADDAERPALLGFFDEYSAHGDAG